MPVLYLDVLLALNLFIDFLLLAATARLMRLPHRRWRLVAAAAFGAASCCSILLPLSAWLAAVWKLLAAVCMVLIAFRWEGTLPFVKRLAVLCVLSTVFAGVSMALYLFAAPAGFYVIGGVVYYDISPLLLIALTVISYGAIRLYDRFTRKNEPRGRAYRLHVQRNGQSICLRALYDSGNNLSEPFSGAPVAVAAFEAVRPLLSPAEQETVRSMWKATVPIHTDGVRLRAVPYHTVSGGGLLPALCPDRLQLEGTTGTRDVTGAYLGVCETLGRGEYTVLIGSALTEP